MKRKHKARRLLEELVPFLILVGSFAYPLVNTDFLRRENAKVQISEVQTPEYAAEDRGQELLAKPISPDKRKLYLVTALKKAELPLYINTRYLYAKITAESDWESWRSQQSRCKRAYADNGTNLERA